MGSVAIADIPGREPSAETWITAQSLGDPQFKVDHGIRYAYMAGSMYKGIASKDLVVALGRAGLLGFLGTGGLDLATVEATIRQIQAELGRGEAYGMNLLASPERPQLEERTVDLYLRYRIPRVEAAAFTHITADLVRYRLHGIAASRSGASGNGTGVAPGHIVAKVSRPEVATAFMQPPPEEILRDLVAAGKLTALEAQIGRSIPMADDVCVEADSGGHTDAGVAYALMPVMLALRDDLVRKHGYRKRIRIGAAGGIGTPQAVAAAFVMGADFVLTGSINQCTREAGTSEDVKDLLQEVRVHDMAYAPAGDMFESGAKVQVVKRGLLFPFRANKLYELYQRHRSLEEIDVQVRRTIEDRYFQRSFDQVWHETREYYRRRNPKLLESIAADPKRRMALVFKWYFVHSTRLALQGVRDRRVDYQIHCGPALGAFNQLVRGTQMESWRERKVADIALRLMRGAADVLGMRLGGYLRGREAVS
jgi:trans-AT polyketide synthase, acyltransferase and oxidoreductase domains